MQSIATESALFEQAATLLDMDAVITLETSSLNSSPNLSRVDDESVTDEHELPRRQKEAIRHRKQRQRRKDEREGLRREEYELSLQLQQLKQACVNVPDASRTGAHIRNCFWRDCAARERQERRRAEAERKRLVAASKTQAAYIETMTKLLRKRPKGSCLDQLDESLKRRCRESLETATYSALLQEIDGCYTRIDDVLGECDLDELPLGIVNSVKYKADGEVEYIQHLNKVLQPFDLEHTCSLAWKVAGHQHRQRDREGARGLMDPSNTITVKFRLVKTLASGNEVSMLQRFVLRRYVRKNLVYHIWKIYSEGEGMLRGMHAEETGWCRFRPSADGFATLTQICVRQVPMVFGPADLSRAKGEEFHTLLKEKVNEDERTITTALDNLLLEDTLAILDEWPTSES